MTIGSLLTVLAGWMILAGFFFALGVTAAFTPETVDIVLLVIVPLVCFAAIVYAVRRSTEWFMAIGPLILLTAIYAGLIGNYIPYEFEIGELSAVEYGSDDRPGIDHLLANLFIFSAVAIVIGPFVGLVALVILWLTGRRLEPADQPPPSQ